MKTKRITKKPDMRPRFGWTNTLDDEPQTIRENKLKGDFAVVVIPLPFRSPKLKARCRAFSKEILASYL